MKVAALKDNTVRVHINDKHPKHPRYEVQEVLQPYEEASMQVTQDENSVKLQLGGDNAVVIGLKPFRMDFLHNNQVVIGVNNDGLLNFEHFRERRDTDPEGSWEETYKTWTDSKPFGPSSVSVDVTFFDSENVYGIPEHTSSFSLKSTKDTDPYRLFNLDVFEYELDNPMALYGNIPFMQSHAPEATVGFFFHNTAEMWVDVDAQSSSQNQGLIGHLKSLFEKTITKPSVHTHWFAESGVLDLFFLLGPKPKDIFRQYSSLTGTTLLPPLFSLGYHQCRWNYNDQEDVLFVSKSLDEHDFPHDVIWLDIEHTDGKRYFTYDHDKFPDPKAMLDTLMITGRRMVNIIDPHVKRDPNYYVHKEASELDLYVKNKDGQQHDAWCWPGSSSWLDFLDPKIRSWYADQFSYDRYKDSTPSLFAWNDMNEPSIFNGPEITMPKDAKHYGGWENRDIHNIYGMWNQAATSEGLSRRSGGVDRPFVLSRAFFAGSQRYGAIWTGDNKADWGHLAISVPMLLSIGLAGLPFAGADMGGFFGNPDKELLVRWYQIGAFQPFMRAHAHLDTKRREPYLLDEPEQSYAREAIKARYRYLPYWYTLFYESSQNGTPPMRPLWVEFPNDTAIFKEQKNFMVGNGLLVAPVTTPHTFTSDVHFPGTDVWYDVETDKKYQAPQTVTVDAPLSKIPVFQRGGTIVPLKMRVRRSSQLAQSDPFTLNVALNNDGSASGTLFIDDYYSFAYKKGKFIYLQFEMKRVSNGFQFSASVKGKPNLETNEWIERIRIYGFPSAPKRILTHNGETLDHFEWPDVLEIKKPSAQKIWEDFSFTIEL